MHIVKIFYFDFGYFKKGKEIVGLKITNEENNVVRLRRLFRDRTTSDRWSCDVPESSVLSMVRRLEEDLSSGKIGDKVDKNDIVRALNPEETKDKPEIVKVELKEKKEIKICGVCNKPIHVCVEKVKSEKVEISTPLSKVELEKISTKENSVKETISDLKNTLVSFVSRIKNKDVIRYLNTKKGQSQAASALVTMGYNETRDIIKNLSSASGAISNSGANTFENFGNFEKGEIKLESSLSLTKIMVVVLFLVIFF